MTDYTHGSSAILGARTDLGKIADRYVEEYGLGPKSSRVAIRACAKKIVQQSGTVRFLAKSFWKTDDLSNSTGERFPNENIPQAQPGATTALQATLRDFGREAKWDPLSPDVHSLMIQGGIRLVEQVYTQKAVIHTLEAMDYRLSALLTDGTDPWTASEVDCTGTKWSATTNVAVTQINTAITNYDGDLDSVLIGRKSSNYLRNCSDVKSSYGGNTGAGRPLDDNQFRDFWSSFGIMNVFVGDTALYGSTVTLYRGDPGGNAELNPSALVRCHQVHPGENANGMSVSIDKYNHGKLFGVYAPSTDDIVLVPSLGVRLINTY